MKNIQNNDFGIEIYQKYPNFDYQRFTKWKYKFIPMQLQRLLHKKLINK